LETGFELQQVLPTAPLAQLVQIEGRAYVQLGNFADARVAYRLGRTIQKRTRLPFELAYDAGHPQSDGQWLAQERTATPDFGLTARLRLQPVSGSAAEPVAELALAGASPLASGSPPDAPVQLDEPRQPETAATPANAVALPMLPESSSASGMHTATLDQMPEPRAAGNTASEELPRPVPLSEVVAAALSALNPDAEQPRAETATNQISPVAIATGLVKPVQTRPVLLTRPDMLAVNHSLNYLFVRLPSADAVSSLASQIEVAEIRQVAGTILARVGVFTSSRRGQQLLQARIDRLAAQGYALEVKGVYA
jgi:hypothetical protein